MAEEEQRFGTPFLWLPVAMIAGVTVELAAPHDIPDSAIALPLMLALAVAIAMRLRGKRAFGALAAAVFFAGMAAAAIQIAQDTTILMDGPVVTHVQGEVLAREGDGKGGWRYRIRLGSTNDPVIRRPPHTVRLVARANHTPIAVGGEIAGIARLSPMSGPALPGGYDFGFNAFFDHIGAIGFFYGAPKPALLPEAASRAGVSARVDLAVERLRDTITHRIRAVLPGEEGALASALIVAKRRAIPQTTVTALRNSGLAHILAISGLHMALVAGTLFFLLRACAGLRPGLVEAIAVKKYAAAASLLVASAYLVLSGGAVSTVRAWVMLAIVLVAVMLDRPALTMRNVAIAAFVVMAVDPASVVGPSFQMSFAATAALVAGYALFRRRAGTRVLDGERSGAVQFVFRFAVGIAFTSLVAGTATAMFAAYHFHRVATLGLIGNLLAMPVITFIVMPFGLIAVLAMPYGLESGPLRIMGGGLHLVIWIAEHVSALGGTAVTGRVSVAVFFAFVAGFTVLVLLRSWLRLIGILPLAVALIITVLPSGSWRPAVLISEDGKLVGISHADVIATNRSRPSDFIFQQWLTSLERSAGPTPRMLPAPKTTAKQRAKARFQPPEKTLVAEMRSALNQPAGRRLVCIRKIWCAGRTVNGIAVIWVADPAYLGTACDIGAIVVTPRAVRMRKCRSGALLFTGATLRRSGSIEIDTKPPPDARPLKTAAKPPGRATHAVTSKATPHIVRIRTSVGGTLRPWTEQRYYDWRSRSYDFDATEKPIRTLMIPAN